MSTHAGAPVLPAAARRPRTTVLIPTYNRARWLRESIASALAQTYEDFLLVVSDNASTDTTRAVVESFDDPRLSYRRLERHAGLNEHFNLCFGSARTEYVYVLPDDDRMCPDALEQTVSVLDANPRVGVVHGCADLVDEHGAVIAEGHHMTGLEATEVETGEMFIRRTLDRGYRVHASTALIRASALADVRLRTEDHPVTDLGLWLRIALSWDIGFLARTLAVVRIHPGSYTAEGRGVTAAGYVQQAGIIGKLHEVKLRFLDEHGERFPDADDLRRIARGAMRRDALDLAGHGTIPERRLVPTVRSLAAAARRDPAVLGEWRAWRMLGASILGRRAVARLKRRTAGASRTAVSPR